MCVVVCLCVREIRSHRVLERERGGLGGWGEESGCYRGFFSLRKNRKEIDLAVEGGKQLTNNLARAHTD